MADWSQLNSFVSAQAAFRKDAWRTGAHMTSSISQQSCQLCVRSAFVSASVCVCACVCVC